jgi:hypothetical protein
MPKPKTDLSFDLRINKSSSQNPWLKTSYLVFALPQVKRSNRLCKQAGQRDKLEIGAKTIQNFGGKTIQNFGGKTIQNFGGKTIQNFGGKTIQNFGAKIVQNFRREKSP